MIYLVRALGRKTILSVIMRFAVPGVVTVFDKGTSRQNYIKYDLW